MPAAGPLSISAYAHLLRHNRNFRCLWTGQFISEIGDWFFAVAIYSLVLENTGSARAIAGAFVLQVLPQFFCAPAAGVIADRVSRRRLMIATDWTRAVIVLLMVFGQLPGYLWLLYVLLFMETICWSLFEPARSGVIPNVTNEDERLVANSLSSTTWSFTLAVGSAIGGVVSAAFGRTSVFVVDSISFVVSALLVSRIRLTEPHLATAKPFSARDLTDFHDLKEGFAYVTQNRRLLWTLFVKTGIALLGANWILLPVMGERMFPLQLASMDERSAGMLGVSLLMGCRGIGAFIGPLIAGRITGTEIPSMLKGILFGFALGAAGYLLLGMASNLLAACLAVVLAHSGGAIAWVYSTTILQTITEDRFRGRVASAEYAFNTLVLSIVTAGAGYLIDQHVSVSRLAVITGLLLLIPVVLWSGVMRRWQDHEPASLA